MKRGVHTTDIDKLINLEVQADYNIDGQVYLLDELRLQSVQDCNYPARINMCIHVLSGSGKVFVDDVAYPVCSPCLIVYLSGQNIGIRIESHSALIRCMAVTDSFMKDLNHHTLKFNDIRYFIIQNPVIRLSQEQVEDLSIFSHIMRKNLLSNNHNHLVFTKLATLALFYGPLYDTVRKRQEIKTKRCPALSSQFFTLLKEHFRTEHNLRFYADKLGISIPYLYDSITSTTGKSPGYWIDHQMVSYARKNLADMEQSILQVAYKLNFAGLPQFGKFFKKQTGQSPSEYRKSLL